MGMYNQSQKIKAETKKILAEANVKEKEVPTAKLQEALMQDITESISNGWQDLKQMFQSKPEQPNNQSQSINIYNTYPEDTYGVD